MTDLLSMLNGQKLIARIMKSVHRPHWARPMPAGWTPNVPVLYYEETNFQGQPYKVPVFVLRTNPCLWFVQGGCVMCNYMIEAGDENQGIGARNIMAQVDWILNHLGDLSAYPYMVVTTAGSFLSPYEVDPSTRIQILERLHTAGLSRLSFESEAKYCTNAVQLTELKDAFGGDVGIGIGLESSNDYIRNVCLNKGLSSRTFQLATTTLQSVGIAFYNYVLLGKPFLTPMEDVLDAVSTIQFAVDRGAYMVVMLVVNIQPHTLTHWLWERHLYRPPSLWAAIEVLKLLPEQYRSRVAIKGIDKAAPNPLAFAQGCPRCTDRLLVAIREWDSHRNFQQLQEASGTCECSDSWQEARVAHSSENNYRVRISTRLQEIAQELAL